MWLAPDDLWSRNRDTGKTTAEIFYSEGVPLVKVARDKVNGCIQMKEHLVLREDGKPRLTFLYGTSDELIKHLQKIQKDKRKTVVYAEEPHELTHYCVTGDTLVKTTKGWKPIEDLVGKKGRVFCVNDKGKIVKKRFFNPMMTNPDAEVYEVELEDGTIIKATANHKFLTNNGFKAVSELTSDDDVLEF